MLPPQGTLRFVKIMDVTPKGGTRWKQGPKRGHMFDTASLGFTI